MEHRDYRHPAGLEPARDISQSFRAALGAGQGKPAALISFQRQKGAADPRYITQCTYLGACLSERCAQPVEHWEDL